MKSGDCFAIERGKYTGKFIVYVKTYLGFYYFLMMPGNFKILKISQKYFEQALEKPNIGSLSNEIPIPPMISFVENLPQEVYEQIEAQYNEVIKNSKNIVTDIFGKRK